MSEKLKQYVDAAMGRASVTILSDDGACQAESLDFPFLRVRARTGEECRAQLRALLEEIVFYRAFKNQSLPTINNISLTSSDLEDHNQRLSELQALERRIEDLRLELQSSSRPKGVKTFAQGLNEFYKTYFALITTLTGLLLALIAYFFFNVDPLETYRETAKKKDNDKITRKMAENYRDIGNKLLVRAEFRAAEDAFKTSLDIYPNDLDARYGLMKAQMLKPEEGRKTYTPEVAEAKLNFLEDVFKSNSTLAEDAFIPYFRGALLKDKNRWDQARNSFQLSQQRNRDFIGNYLQLGYMNIIDGKIDDAVGNFCEALAKAGDHPVALNNLGALYTVNLDFDQALELLKKARGISKRLETYIILGDVYRYKNDIESAIVQHEIAWDMLNDPKTEEGINYGVLTYNFMPESPTDTYTNSIAMQFYDLARHKVLVKYCLSLDYALKGNLKIAESAFQEGYAADPYINQAKEYGCWYLNQITYTLNNVTGLKGETRQWLEEKKKTLPTHQTCFGR